MTEVSGSPPRPEAASWRRHAFLVAGLLGVAGGCISLDAIRQREYDRITIPQIEKAARSEDAEVLRGLESLLERRLDDPPAIDVDLALEALVSLMRAERTHAIGVVRRCALEDPDEECRYVALEVLARLAPHASRDTISAVAAGDGSDLVRDHARELLEP